MVEAVDNLVKVLRHQHEFVSDRSPWLLSDGGRGSGKTYGLCLKLAERAGVPGAREGLFRQRLIDLKTTTLRTLLEGDGSQPPILMPGSFSHDKALKIIRIHGGGDIIYNGMDQGDVSRTMGSTGRGSSMNLTGAAFDEWVEIEEASVVQVAMGVRVKIDGLCLQRYGVCNPAQPGHWLSVRFGINDDATKRPGHKRIQAPARLNHYNPKEFLHELRNLQGVARLRYYDGLWVGADGLVYDRFNRDEHVLDRTAYRKSSILGVDDGYTDPFVVLDIAIDSDGRKHIAREVYESKLVMTEKIERVKRMWDGESPVVVDSAAPDLIESLRRAGVSTAVACDKGPGSINFGINLVQTELATDSDGVPMLTVNPNCTNTIREFESYEWKPGLGGVKDQPRDANNHTADSLRYALRYICEERGGRVLSSYSDDKPAEAASVETFDELRDSDPDWGY